MVEEERDPGGLSLAMASQKRWWNFSSFYTFKDEEKFCQQRNVARGWRGEGEVAFQVEALLSKGPEMGLRLVSLGNEKSRGPGAGHACEVLRLAWWAATTVYGGPRLPRGGFSQGW